MSSLQLNSKLFLSSSLSLSLYCFWKTERLIRPKDNYVFASFISKSLLLLFDAEWWWKQWVKRRKGMKRESRNGRERERQNIPKTNGATFSFTSCLCSFISMKGFLSFVCLSTPFTHSILLHLAFGSSSFNSIFYLSALTLQWSWSLFLFFVGFPCFFFSLLVMWKTDRKRQNTDRLSEEQKIYRQNFEEEKQMILQK